MEENSNVKKQPHALVVAGIAGIIAYLAMSFVHIVCNWLQTDAEIKYIVTVAVTMLGVGILVGVYQRMVHNAKYWEDHFANLAEARADDLVRKDRELGELIAELREEKSRLIVECLERRRLEQCDMELRDHSDVSVRRLVGLVAQIYKVRRGGVKNQRLAELQDEGLDAILTFLAGCIPVDRERAKSVDTLANGPWDVQSLNTFFGIHREDIVGALRNLAAHKNAHYAELVFALPPDVALYFTRMTLVDPAQQPAPPPAG